MVFRLKRLGQGMLGSAACLILLTASAPRPLDELDRVRAYTRDIEFDYISWIADAAAEKVQQGAAGVPGYVSHSSGKVAVNNYILLTRESIRDEAALNSVYADPSIADKQAASRPIRAELESLRQRLAVLQPIAEAVLQEQVSEAAADLGLTLLGQPMPAVLFHSSPVPNALIVSRRDRIQEIASVYVLPDLPVDQQVALEGQEDTALDVSSLVVPIGGVGVYPTMVMRTSDLSWLVDTISHEWTHNFLEFRPLGLLYDQSPELRTMNETTASISGGEISRLVLRLFYPELASSGSPSELRLVVFPPLQRSLDATEPVPFSFNKEMHTTRVTVDALLAQGMIAAAEGYMEQRRQVFVENGYDIRKLNQAYFAFYGAYADVPGGAAGEDPVGPAVRVLRAKSRSLADFLNRISWMTSFADLRKAVSQ